MRLSIVLVAFLPQLIAASRSGGEIRSAYIDLDEFDTNFRSKSRSSQLASKSKVSSSLDQSAASRSRITGQRSSRSLSARTSAPIPRLEEYSSNSRSSGRSNSQRRDRNERTAFSRSPSVGRTRGVSETREPAIRMPHYIGSSPLAAEAPQKTGLSRLTSAGGAMIQGLSETASSILGDPAVMEAVRAAAVFTGTMLTSAAIAAANEYISEGEA